MKNFRKQIKNACKNFFYFSIIEELHITSDNKDTKAAIVSIIEDMQEEKYYTIFYKYKTMKKIDNYGYFKSEYDNDENCIYNAYIDACEELSKFAK